MHSHPFNNSLYRHYSLLLTLTSGDVSPMKLSVEGSGDHSIQIILCGGFAMLFAQSHPLPSRAMGRVKGRVPPDQRVWVHTGCADAGSRRASRILGIQSSAMPGVGRHMGLTEDTPRQLWG